MLKIGNKLIGLKLLTLIGFAAQGVEEIIAVFQAAGKYTVPKQIFMSYLIENYRKRKFQHKQVKLARQTAFDVKIT